MLKCPLTQCSAHLKVGELDTRTLQMDFLVLQRALWTMHLCINLSFGHGVYLHCVGSAVGFRGGLWEGCQRLRDGSGDVAGNVGLFHRNVFWRQRGRQGSIDAEDL